MNWVIIIVDSEEVAGYEHPDYHIIVGGEEVIRYNYH